MTEADVTLLDNAVWHSLVHAHQEFAEREGQAARYDPDVSIFGAWATTPRRGWRDLASVVGSSGIAVLVPRRDAAAPGGLDPASTAAAATRWCCASSRRSTRRPASAPLGPDDVGEMLALVELTQPGPFAVRTIELGGYVGVFDGDRLVAMAGQRLAPPGFREVSAVCTHPDFRGRGLAAGLSALVARGILERGERPFLHHASDNDAARRVYEALGFEFRRQVVFAALGAP